MSRMRMAAVSAVVALLAAACGDDGGEAVTPDEPQDVAEAAGTTQPDPEDVSDGGDPAEEDIVRPSDADDDPADASGSEDGTSTSEDGGDAVPMDAEALLASAVTALDGRSVRGEASFDIGPGFSLSTGFESDVEGDLAVVAQLPPGVDPDFPFGAEAEFRYVGGMIYARPPTPAETLAELGLDEAWFVAEPVGPGDPMNDAMASAGGLMCIFPQSTEAFFGECDPVGDTGTFLEMAQDPEIAGREDARGTEVTRVLFRVSLLDLAGDAFGQAPGTDDSESPDGAFFDDSSSDPFAEGMEEFFALLDTGFEVEVWIDDDNLIRRLTFDLASMFADLAGPDEPIPSTRLTLEFFDFDADISVDAPPPEAIVDEDLLTGGDDYATSEEYEAYDEGCEEFYDEEYDESYVVCE